MLKMQVQGPANRGIGQHRVEISRLRKLDIYKTMG